MSKKYKLILTTEVVDSEGTSMQGITLEQKDMDYETLVVFQQAMTRAITEALFALGNAGVAAKKEKK